MKPINRYIPKPIHDYLMDRIHIHIKWKDLFESEICILDNEGLIIACDTVLRVSGSRDLNRKGFCEIPRDFFHKILHNDYKIYLDYLIENKILITDNLFVAKEKSKGYKINETFLGNLETTIIENPLYNKRTIKAINTSSKLKVRAPIRKTLEKVIFDFDSAINHLLYEYHNQVPQKDGSPMNQYQKMVLEHKLLQLRDKQFWTSRSETNGRISSNLTILNKNYKCFILGYETQLDITASQPTTILILINMIRSIQGVKGRASISSLSLLASYVCKMILKYLGKTDGQRVWDDLKTVKIPLEKEIETYEYLCKTGQLYEAIQKEMSDSGIKMTRDEVKTNTFVTFYSSNKNHDPIKKIFAKMFPSIYAMMNRIKSIPKSKGGYGVFSVMMQGIESYVWVENILPKLDKMNIEYLFIHDAIIVKEQDQYRSEITILEQYNYYGIEPNISKEDLKTGKKIKN